MCRIIFTEEGMKLKTTKTGLGANNRLSSNWKQVGPTIGVRLCLRNSI